MNDNEIKEFHIKHACASMLRGKGEFNIDIEEQRVLCESETAELCISKDVIDKSGKFDLFTFAPTQKCSITINNFDELSTWENLPTKLLKSSRQTGQSVFETTFHLDNVKNFNILKDITLTSDRMSIKPYRMGMYISLRGFNCNVTTLSFCQTRGFHFTHLLNLYNCERVDYVLQHEHYPLWINQFIKFFCDNGGSSGSPYEAYGHMLELLGEFTEEQ